MCVLVVEDDPALQRMILNYFGENNIRTLMACGRQDMVSQLDSTEVNLVILDLRLGQEDGLDLLRESGRTPTCQSSSSLVTAATTSIASSGSSSAPTII
jgi:DNA-binding response OmpR family regulator